MKKLKILFFYFICVAALTVIMYFANHIIGTTEPIMVENEIHLHQKINLPDGDNSIAEICWSNP